MINPSDLNPGDNVTLVRRVEGDVVRYDDTRDAVILRGYGPAGGLVFNVEDWEIEKYEPAPREEDYPMGTIVNGTNGLPLYIRTANGWYYPCGRLFREWSVVKVWLGVQGERLVVKP